MVGKRIRYAVAVLFILIFSTGGTPAAAQGINCQLEDQAGLLKESEAAELEEQVKRLEEETGWDLMAVTTNDAQGMNAVDYGEQWLDQHIAGEDGVICLIDMDNREVVLSSTGEPRYYMTDDRKEQIFDNAYPKVSNGEYGAALSVMLDGVETYYRSGVPKGSHLYDEDTGEVMKYGDTHRRLTVTEILAAAAAALSAGGITIGAVIGSYRLKFGGYKYPIEKNGTVNLERKEDVFINQIVTHRHIPKNNDSSKGKGAGRSTVHTGSGGRSYSSSSRKF